MLHVATSLAFASHLPLPSPCARTHLLPKTLGSGVLAHSIKDSRAMRGHQGLIPQGGSCLLVPQDFSQDLARPQDLQASSQRATHSWTLLALWNLLGRFKAPPRALALQSYYSSKTELPVGVARSVFALALAVQSFGSRFDPSHHNVHARVPQVMQLGIAMALMADVLPVPVLYAKTFWPDSGARTHSGVCNRNMFPAYILASWRCWLQLVGLAPGEPARKHFADDGSPQQDG
ncbi:hypothetical protein DFH06DRAFT_1300493 [Mycena polygramma]|nr:hypothetical protein DFH06DRAFT_1300493 [Mycena polygramma]